MALIKCPECNKDISDKAEVCIHCGYPIQKLNNLSLDFKSKKVIIPSFKEFSDKKIQAIKIVREITGFGLADASSLVEQEFPVVKDGISINQANVIREKFQKADIDANIVDSTTTLIYVDPKTDTDKICCPKCGSLEYHAGARGYNLLTGFIGSGKVVMTCLKCGNRWKPSK
jgi:ribosomal protein L7/L12